MYLLLGRSCFWLPSSNLKRYLHDWWTCYLFGSFDEKLYLLVKKCTTKLCISCLNCLTRTMSYVQILISVFGKCRAKVFSYYLTGHTLGLARYLIDGQSFEKYTKCVYLLVYKSHFGLHAWQLIWLLDILLISIWQVYRHCVYLVWHINLLIAWRLLDKIQLQSRKNATKGHFGNTEATLSPLQIHFKARTLGGSWCIWVLPLAYGKVYCALSHHQYKWPASCLKCPLKCIGSGLKVAFK